MFGWLADLLVKSSVVGSSCPCCNGQKEQLKKMQKAVLNGQLEEEEEAACHCSDGCHCSGHGCGQEGESCSCTSQNRSDMSMSYHYQL